MPVDLEALNNLVDNVELTLADVKESFADEEEIIEDAQWTYSNIAEEQQLFRDTLEEWNNTIITRDNLLSLHEWYLEYLLGTGWKETAAIQIKDFIKNIDIQDNEVISE